MKKKLLSYMSIMAAGLLLASCTNDVSYDYEGESSYNNQPMDVTFEIYPADLGISTREDESYEEGPSLKEPSGPGAYQPTVGKGKNIDMLIYAVYLKEEKEIKDTNGKTIVDSTTGKVKTESIYTLLTQYGYDYVIDVTMNKTNMLDGCNALERTNLSSHEGHTVVYLGNTFTGEKTSKGYFPLTLRVMRNQSYVFVFWAQSSKTDAYDTENLEAITVHYDKDIEGKDYLNNDELRDAFYKADHLSVGSQQLDSHRKVYLTRPFAQINVGTTGADYLHITKGEVFSNKDFKYSRIQLTGVATTMNLITDEIKDVKPDPITFEWSRFPAYLNDLEPGEDFPDGFVTVDEEFLYVNLDNHKAEGHTGEKVSEDKQNDGIYLDYKTDFPTIKDGKYLTETFKYLSMCYILVPSSLQSGQNSVANSKSLLSSVKIQFSVDGKAIEFDKVQNTQKLTNVPVQMNYRTNILGGFGPDSNVPNSIFNLYNMPTTVVSYFNDDVTSEWQRE